MPKRTDIQRIMIIGAGPIVIGQACEFDYSGSQACRALMGEGYEVILINSNPATIMTDPNMATRTYIEPITPDVVEKVIETEKPDALLPTMGGQTALNVAFSLYESGVLSKHGVELIGANVDAIRVAEDRQAFRDMVERVGLGVLRSETVTSFAQAEKVAESLGFPLIVRSAFTLGGSGGSVVWTREEFKDAVQHGIDLSPIHQVLLEESALGWKEYEYEVMRDKADNVVIVSSVENIDPMGVHTGDSITVAPAQTLSDKEYHELRNASLTIIREVGVDAGGCNIQFAVHPHTGRVVVIEMNPRVSRSSALVSKATGVPIAKISAKLAVGMTLDEIPNDITEKTPACFEPALDYVVTKVPRFSFEKFPGAKDELTPQMKSVGEVMAIGRTFKESLQKALRGLEVGLNGFQFPRLEMTDEDVLARLQRPSSDRMRWLYQAFVQNISTETLYELTGIDPWFLENFRQIEQRGREVQSWGLGGLTPERLFAIKSIGFSNAQIAQLLNVKSSAIQAILDQHALKPVYKSVDTCAGEFAAQTPYFYSSYEFGENEAPDYSRSSSDSNRRVMILGGGPNRIGQGIEFDYCCVHAAFVLQKLGYEAIMVNSNPETVSTDYDISNRLYFEPLTPEDVANLLKQEQPMGVIAQLGGQTPLKLVQALRNESFFPLLGTSADDIDQAEDRDRFTAILDSLALNYPDAGIARTEEEALAVARKIGYPLIARPSYVLGGRAMQIFYREESLKRYLDEVIRVEPDYPVLLDRFLEEAMEIDVDAVSDGTNTHIGAILEHIEHAGVHSGDSACVWPPQRLSDDLHQQVVTATNALAQKLQVKGLLNIQFAVKDGKLYVLEVNPRGSRTVPFVCKATGIPLVEMAVRVMLGEPLVHVLQSSEFKDRKIPTDHVAVKEAVFPFIKFRESDPKLGPEMRSTGEVMGIDANLPMAFAKAQLAAGEVLPQSGTVFISVNDFDKEKVIPVAQQFQQLGFKLVATAGTAAHLSKHGLSVTPIRKKTEGSPNAQEMIEEEKIQFVINTPVGREALIDDSHIRKASVLHQVPMATTIAGAKAMADAIEALKTTGFGVNSLQSYHGVQSAQTPVPSA